MPLASSSSTVRLGRFQAAGFAATVRAILVTGVSLADLEDRDVLVSVAEVRRHNVEEAPEQPLSEDGVVARQRIGDANRAATRQGLAVDRRHGAGQPESLEVALRDQSGGDDLALAGTAEG